MEWKVGGQPSHSTKGAIQCDERASFRRLDSTVKLRRNSLASNTHLWGDRTVTLVACSTYFNGKFDKMEQSAGRDTRHMLVEQRFQHIFEKELIQEIQDCSQLRKIPSDTVVMEVGQVITHMPLVVSGSIKVMTVDDEGDELLLYYLELGDTCAMTLNCCSRSAKSAITAITEEPSELLFIPVDRMEEWMVKYRSWRNFVLDSYNLRLNEMLEAIDNLAFHNMEERLVKYLRDKAMVTNTDELRVTHYQIANDLHSSRVVVSRLMKKLELDGVIKQHRNRVEFLEFKS